MVGSTANLSGMPLWLLAELTYRCPLQCPYCSNPLEIASYKNELSTDDWLKVLREARKLGAMQLGLSGGEPLVRKDLELIVKEGADLGYYSNLITSGVGMDEERVVALKEAGLDHIQISFQASDRELNDFLGGTSSFQHKLDMARAVKANKYPMVLNIVIHRQNIDHIEDILKMTAELKADYVELASTQYYGWSALNVDSLLPSREQLERAESIAHAYQDQYKDKMRILYVVPDYYETRPKACMNGWGSVFLTIAPDGRALPCHAAATIPDIEFPNVKDHSIEHIWNNSGAFNKFRGFGWMKDPCRTCPEKEKDFGGCRCQAFKLTGDASNADPVCSKSSHHQLLSDKVASLQDVHQLQGAPIVFRNMSNSKSFSDNSD
ncbi:MAG: pyrroloquinoline quinone biosynthesis protein PqqE [Gammaproteobacteria bacterium]